MFRHPDKNSERGATETFMKIKQAYQVFNLFGKIIVGEIMRKIYFLITNFLKIMMI